MEDHWGHVDRWHLFTTGENARARQIISTDHILGAIKDRLLIPPFWSLRGETKSGSAGGPYSSLGSLFVAGTVISPHVAR